MSGRPPQTSSPGFVTVEYLPCSDCLDNTLGGTRRRRYVSVRRLTRGSPPGCQTCGGSGEIKLDQHDPRRIDPYARKA